MGISPISNLPPLVVIRSSESVMEPLPMQRVESSSRTGDESYHPSKQKSSRGAEDSSPEEGAEDQVAEDQSQNMAAEDQAQTSTQSTDEPPGSRINFLA
jgi:hypothetical protein